MMRQALNIFALYFLLSVLLATPVVSQEATEGSSVRDEIRERVREKVENLLKKPRAVVGELAEISDSTLEVRARSGNLEMAATGKETTYLRVAKGKRTEIKFADLVLGDFIIAMGFRNGNDVLEAGRVITYDASPLQARRAVFGVVQGNERGTITIQHPKTGEVWTVETTRNTRVTTKDDQGFEEIEVKEVQIGDRIVAAGTPDKDEENTLSAGRIHIIPGRAEGQQ